MFRLWQKTFVMNTTLGGGVDEDPNPWIGKVEHVFPEYSTNHSSQMNGVPLWGETPAGLTPPFGSTWHRIYRHNFEDVSAPIVKKYKPGPQVSWVVDPPCRSEMWDQVSLTIHKDTNWIASILGLENCEVLSNTN